MRSETCAGTVITVGREVQDRPHARVDEPVGDLLGRGGRRRDDADRDRVLLDDAGEVVEVFDHDAADALADLLGVGVDERGDAESPRAEARGSSASAAPRLPTPTMTTGQSSVSPSSREISWSRYSTS